jgi:hypothetical protein
MPAPKELPADASGGHAPPGFDPSRACASWRSALGPHGAAAETHVSFPELDPARSCFVPVRYEGASVPHADPAPPGCGYPRSPDVTTSLTAAAERYEAIAAGARREPLPTELACELPDDVRRSAATSNARTLRSLVVKLGSSPSPTFPYAAVATFGFGRWAQRSSELLAFRPGDACSAIDAAELERLDVNVTRAERAAKAFQGHVAPVVIVSGGAVHAPLTEAFMLDYLVTCRFGVPPDAVLVDPCADHTHTNVRNSGAILRELGGRTAYLVTDDGLQAGYLEERTAFDAIGGSIDQRAIRDFGYLLGSHRRASVGMRAGFWYTPYRFWAEPEAGLGSFTCIP